MTAVVVVGAGIVGAAVAYEAARAGADVTLLDRSTPASGVTGGSFAWVGGPRAGDVPDASHPVRRHVLDDYRRLERDVPGVRVSRHGALRWAAPAGAGPRLGGDEVARLEPHLRPVPTPPAHLVDDGGVDPVALTQALVAAARGLGARLVTGCTVTALRVGDGGVVGVETTTAFVPSDTVVVTAGVDAPALCAPLGFDLPVASSPALLLRVAAPPGLVRTLVALPDLEVRELSPGLLVLAVGGAGVAGPDDVDRAAHAALARLVARFEGAEDVRLLGAQLGGRPMPVDGLPVVGPVPGVRGAYVAVMHSAVTLAPSVARLVAAEVVEGVEAPELAGLRPARFLE